MAVSPKINKGLAEAARAAWPNLEMAGEQDEDIDEDSLEEAVQLKPLPQPNVPAKRNTTITRSLTYRIDRGALIVFVDVVKMQLLGN